jgi:hypothetical protein
MPTLHLSRIKTIYKSKEVLKLLYEKSTPYIDQWFSSI